MPVRAVGDGVIVLADPDDGGIGKRLPHPGSPVRAGGHDPAAVRRPGHGMDRAGMRQRRTERLARGDYPEVGLALAGYFARARASDPPLDLKLINQARATLAQDREIEPFNLGVEVADRAATLHGKVPNAELRRRAADLLKNMPEFREVRNELTINPDQRPIVEPSSPSRYPSEEPSRALVVPGGTLMKGAPSRQPVPLILGEQPPEANIRDVDTDFILSFR